jgi:catechol 2,3-dioxygenase-like lactoylglutathione lyase family enzyme
MSSTEVSTGSASGDAATAPVDLKLEVITIPVSDIERSKAFYTGLGWRLDAEIQRGPIHILQFTPPHSDCSVSMGAGLSTAFGLPEMAAGSQQRVEMVVSDIEAARDDLISRGAQVGEIFHLGDSGPEPGLAPGRASYGSYATFKDPDGNSFLLQEVTDRLPGRLWED